MSSYEGANVLIGGNSAFIDKELLHEAFVKAQWLERIGRITVTDANRKLVDAARQLCNTIGIDLEVVNLEWRTTDSQGNEVDNRGALYQAYQTLVIKSNAVMTFSTGEDKAAIALSKDCTKLGISFIGHEVMPVKKDDIFKTPLVSAETREKLIAAREQMLKMKSSNGHDSDSEQAPMENI